MTHLMNTSTEPIASLTARRAVYDEQATRSGRARRIAVNGLGHALELIAALTDQVSRLIPRRTVIEWASRRY